MWGDYRPRYGRFRTGANSGIEAAPEAGGPVAQWLEPAAHNRLVAGSSPAGPTTPHSKSDNFNALTKVGHRRASKVGHLCSIFGPPKQRYDARRKLLLIGGTRVMLWLPERLPAEPRHEHVCACTGFSV